MAGARPNRTALATSVQTQRWRSALLRNIYPESAHAEAGAAWLAAYVRTVSESLARENRIEKGQLAWPDPATISADDAVRK
jgi:hypothetical protein